MIELPKGITLIAAIGSQGELGLDNKLPWPYDKEDMAWFQQVTRAARWCIAGYNTFNSLPKSMFMDPDRDIVMDDTKMPPMQFMLYWWGTKFPDSVVVIGGAKTYKRWLPYTRTVLLTKMTYDGPADTFMPRIW